ISDTKREARTTSRVVTPKSFLGLYTPARRKTSAQMGTVELTGLLMTRMLASGHDSAQALARSRTMEALVLKRSSRVMPGLRGTPAGMRTTSEPLRAAARPEGLGSYPLTEDLVLTWEMSAATPGTRS